MNVRQAIYGIHILLILELSEMAFDKSFIFGAATASFQVEGAAYEDGKGLSIWDLASKKPGYINDGSNGDVACDHYHRFKEDIVLMKKIGIKAYRFSVSWCRVMPDGIGKVNKKGIEFYDNLINELLANDIEPYLNIFHWDYPYELHKKGGWLNSESPLWFREYTKILVNYFSDRVKNWLTVNEPQCFLGHGYCGTRHTPWLNLENNGRSIAAHNVLLAHGLAVQTIRTYAKLNPTISLASQAHILSPVVENKDNIEACRKLMFSMTDTNLLNNTWWLDPIVFGEYPEDGLRLFGKDMVDYTNEDMKIISTPIDYVGLNAYGAKPVMTDENGSAAFAPLKVGYPENSREWYVDFDCMFWASKFFYERYNKPIVFTENGTSLSEWVCDDGRVHDAMRIDYLKRNLAALEKAYDSNIPIKGYFAWSLMDNMEWMAGYTKRFGLIYVDFETQERIIKDSGYWYRDYIKSKGN